MLIYVLEAGDNLSLMIEAACDSDVGRERSRNEDNCYYNGAIMKLDHEGPPDPLYHIFEPDGLFFAVFDGMGGVEDGELASYLAGCAFQDCCADLEHRGLIAETFYLQAVKRMNRCVYQEAERRGNSMGTTFVSVCFCEDTAMFCNVGDSRVYRLRNGNLMQLSVDDTASVSYGTALDKNRKPGLTQCIGIPEAELILEPHIRCGRIHPGDVYLLCSDGLTDHVSDTEIQTLIGSGCGMDVCLQQLIDLALDRGGSDNVTAIIARALEPIGFRTEG